ncbi:Phage tail tape measure protein [Bradyrhizobium sp. ORS 375]|uniref:phage tail tape measure protein n=1 Tax=Bradyrhizobium sp. (strain ORS 375) TaxID=566679 RepID=UPI0002406F0F|nr:phage tail tape measure protein [Bradyrhizobium sp. ORS 375]CCD94692.1 Phage tail tape measure protein [Bradyrhizobium sp. ORS 375]
MATGFSVFVNIGGKVSPSLNAAVNAAKSQVNSLGASLAGMASRMNAPFAAVNNHLANTSKRMAAIQRHGRNATLGVTVPGAWFGANMIKDAAEFAKAGNMVEALGEATKEQRVELSKMAQDLAGKYDAGGATGIMKSATELLKAGFTFQQAKGALEQVLAASALAGDMTPADVGASLSKTITQFRLPMKTYEQAMKSSAVVTDRMVYAAVSTVASMKDISESFKYAGGVASTTGNSLDSVTAMVMAFAKAGVLGSEAGVALRSAIVRLVKMPKGGMKALNRIGMNLGDYTQARPVTADSVLESLKGDGIDASSVKSQIAEAIATKKNDHAGMSAAITKAVQGAIGTSSAVDADKISESVNDAVTAAGSKVDITKFMTDLKKKMDAGVATTGDIAQILEARHISRYMALLKADLPAMIKEVEEKSEGYSQKQYKIANQGLPAILLQLGASWEKFRNTIVESVGEDIANAFTKLTDTLQKLSATNPELLRTGVYFAAAAAAAGPLLFVLGAIGRVGILAMRGLNLALLGVLMPLRLFAGLIAGVATAAVGRLAAMAIGFRMLTALGAGATLSALGGSLLALGRSVLLFPVTALRAIGLAMWALVANPVGLIITALVAALTALGVWVYNNWAGIKECFAGFGEGFMKGLGEAGPAVQSIASNLSSVYNWVSQLLGPLDATNAKWREWGATVGGAAASGVQAVISAIQSLIGFFNTAIEKAVAMGNAIKNALSGGWGATKSWLDQGNPANPIEGARAKGGPVSFGKPYLVGEQGPELFVPGMSGRIESNDRLRGLTSEGAAAVASSSENNTSVSRTNSAQITVQVNGGNPNDVRRAAEDAVYAAFARLESEQRGLLSD